MHNKLKPLSSEQNQEVSDLLQELKNGFDLYNQAATKPIPKLPSPSEATESDVRYTLLEQRAQLMGLKSSLEIIGTTSEHFLKVLLDGRKPLSLLRDWTKLAIRVFDNLIEENLLWEEPDPTGYSVAKRRRNIFAENRRIGEDANKKLIEAASAIYELTDVNILDWVDKD